MKPQLRPSVTDEVLAAIFPPLPQRELHVNPDGEEINPRALEKILKRATRLDAVVLSPGRYNISSLSKSLEIRAAQTGTVILEGTLKIQGVQVLLRGVELQPGANPAVVLENGEIFFDDCVIHGKIDAQNALPGARMFMRNCLVENLAEGIVLGAGVEAEIAGSLVRACEIGIFARAQSVCAIYQSTFEECGGDTATTGSGVFAEKASIYCEGAVFSRNNVGACLKQCHESRLLSTSFRANRRAGLIVETESSATAKPLVLHSCLFDRQELSEYAQLTVTGGEATISHSVIHAAEGTGLAVFQTNIHLEHCRFISKSSQALEVHASEITADHITCKSPAAAFVAEGCKGVVRHGSFHGTPPTLLTDSSALYFEAASLHEFQEEEVPVAPDAEKPEAALDSVIHRIQRFVGQLTPRRELERLLRQAQASRQRILGGMPAPEQNFHTIFTGPPSTGKASAARLLTEGLHAIGLVRSSHVSEVSLAGLSTYLSNGASAGKSGGIFIRLNVPADATQAMAIEQLIHQVEPDAIVMLEGERDQIRRLLRGNAMLENAFRNRFHFAPYNPPELADFFAQLCERDRIPLSAEATEKILLAFHIFSDRHDKRYAHIQGVKMLYDISHRRYVERCSAEGRFDLEMIPADLDFASTVALRSAAGRSPAFVSTCPHCGKENPWIPGMLQPQACLHCESLYETRWGVWKNSSYYRRQHDATLNIPQTGAVAARRLFNLPSRKS